MQPGFKRKWKASLVLLCIALGLTLIFGVVFGTDFFRSLSFRISGYGLLMLGLGFLVLAVLCACLLIAQRCSFVGRRWAGVAFASPFCAFLLAGAVMGFKSLLDIAGFSGDSIWAVIGLVGCLAAALLAVDLYVFSHIAPRYNGGACGIIATVLTLTVAAASVTMLTWRVIELIRAHATSGSFADNPLVRTLFLLLPVAALILICFAVTVGMTRARRARRAPHPSEKPMFPLLESYRAALRKERA
ncbi:MAG: hypothetical protein IJK28_01600 [Clostridia bacterium]|nr:hypothetical protein [Clostridia bacterium]